MRLFLLFCAMGAIALLHPGAPAWAAPGDLDFSFGTQGVALRADGEDGAQAMVLQADGKPLTATLTDAAADRASLRITRFTTGGGVDGSFGVGGVASVSVGVDVLSSVRAMLRQSSDNKIVVGGRALDAFAVTRLSPAGGLDAGFGSGGTARTKIAGDDEVFALAQQPDGKIVAVGRADDGSDADFAVVRYTTGGIPDPSFSDDGVVTVDFGGNDAARAVAIQADGSIVVAGISENSHTDVAVARLTSGGSPDPSFGSSGKVTTSITPRDDSAWALLIQPDGRIVVAGEADDDFALVRYATDGDPDSTFGSGGIARTNVSAGAYDGARAVVRQGDGKLVAGGIANPALAGDFALVRYTTAGLTDATFGDAGRVTTSAAASFDEELTSLALQSDGKLIAAGLSDDGSTAYQMLARYQGATAQACGDADANGTVQAGDALRVLRKAVGQEVTCEPAVCDVDSSGGIVATDALRVLRKAVGQDVILDCP